MSLTLELQNMRQAGDYDDMFDWEESDVVSLFKPTETLLNKMRDLITVVR